MAEDLEIIYQQIDEEKRKAFHPFQCPHCGRFIKITHAASGYGLDGAWWEVYGICSKCGNVHEGA